MSPCIEAQVIIAYSPTAVVLNVGRGLKMRPSSVARLLVAMVLGILTLGRWFGKTPSIIRLGSRLYTTLQKVVGTGGGLVTWESRPIVKIITRISELSESLRMLVMTPNIVGLNRGLVRREHA